jgi:argininosuccinate lyase
LGDDVHDVLDFRRAIEQRSVPGGTATAAVKAQIETAKAVLARASSQVKGEKA